MKPLSVVTGVATLPAALLLTGIALSAQLHSATGSAQDNATAADTIFFHGSILTGDRLTAADPGRVSALAIRDRLVTAIGDDATVLQRRGPHTEVIDLHGGFAMPGFNDAHTHMGEAGRIKLSVDLTGCASLAEMLARIRTAAQAAPPGQWLAGGGWDHTRWPSKTLPTRQDIDSVAAGRPAFFVRVDGHIAVASTAALTAAGIGNTTPDPAGGKFDHNPSGALTGIVREDPAMQMVRAHIPPPSHGLRARALSLAMADAVAHGVTSVQDYSDWDDFLLYEELEQAGRLPVRIAEWLTFNDPVPTLIDHRAHHPAADRMLHTTMLKGFMDGSLGSRTAALNAPYADDPGNSGLPRYQQDRLDQMAVVRAHAGFQLGFHAIGDRAAAMALDAFAAAAAQDPADRDRRNRIEHDQVVAPEDFARYKSLGVIASMQPNHLLTDMNWAEQRLGQQRARYSYAWKRFLDAGIPLAFGTDYPVEPITPFRGLYCAVTRMNEDGSKSYFPEDKLTLGQALYAYTQGSAYAELTESWKGKLVPGYVADLIVLDRDLTRIPAHDILGTQVLRTVVNGETVYQANARAR